MRISDWSSDVCSSDLQHEIGRVERGGDAGGEAERDRRGELLKRLALFGTARLRRQKSGDLAEHGELGGRCRGARPDGRAELAQEEHLRGLAGRSEEHTSELQSLMRL